MAVCICGKEFERKNKNHKYCSKKCRNEGRNQDIKAGIISDALKKSVRINEDGTIEKKCSKCGEWKKATLDNFHRMQGSVLDLDRRCADCFNKYKVTQRQTDEGQMTVKNFRCKRRAIKAYALHVPFTREMIEERDRFFNNECAYSGIKLDKNTSDQDYLYTEEHIRPISKGGDDAPWNIIPACGTINDRKQDADIEEWYKNQDYFTEEKLNRIQQWQKLMWTKYGHLRYPALIELKSIIEKDIKRFEAKKKLSGEDKITYQVAKKRLIEVIKEIEEAE